ncbi:MAG: glycosyltransferase family 2 protein [Candidatus Daviesbacteria bacterium]|nr:glycosyltransferase family 2 protein [Candidatus Daviesbacteria bacterium]MDD5415787.1 glycosyltransferase family 2 protein [Candidatus Daviesbacteria bacterium]
MISAIIITLNEEDKIGRAIKSLKGLADEIIVVDSGSSDKTLDIAESLGAKVYFRKFDNFANQKNWAVSKTKGDWILSLDADEEILGSLAEEIKEASKSNNFAGYLLPRRNFIFKKEIKHSRWSPDLHIWLWKKDCGRWVGDVHEEVVVSGKVGLLKGSKIHNSHDTVSSFIKANNLYSTLDARKLFRKNIKFSFIKMFRETFFEFFIRFFYKRGFLDGSEGFILAYIMGIYKLTVWIKLWELERKE